MTINSVGANTPSALELIGEVGAAEHIAAKIGFFEAIGGNVYESAKISHVSGLVNATSGQLAFSTAKSGNLLERMRITEDGAMAIGTISPAAVLDVTDTSTTTSAIVVPRAPAFTGTAANGMVRYNTTSNLFEFRQNGSWVNYTAVSDGRLKTNVVPVQKGLDIINALNPVFFDWDRTNPRTQSFNNQHQVGFIAQEVEKVLPEVVNKGEDSYRSVEYGKMVAVAIAAIKELYHQVTGHDTRLKELELRNAKLEAENKAKAKEMAELKRRMDTLEARLNSKIQN
jgi:hypothetical protein